MLAKLRPRRPSHATVVAYLALFAAVSTGGAYAANTVFSTDIVDGEVKTPDLANKAVTAANLANNAVTAQKVKDNNLIGADVLDNTLTGTDINESTLGQVPSALVGGHGRYIGGQQCNPELALFITCAVVNLDIPAGLPRVHVIGVASMGDPIDSGDDGFHGSCRVATSRGSIPESVVTVASGGPVESPGSHQIPITVTAITGPLSPGPVAFAIECNEGRFNVTLANVGVTAVVIAPN